MVGEAILTACHVLNKIWTKDNEITPYEKWAKRRTTLSYLRTWGRLAKVNVPIPKKVSSDQRLWTALIWATLRIALAIDL